MKRKILFISMCLPYEKVGHAGGKTFNYYINSFASDCNNEVSLISKILPDEVKHIDDYKNKIMVYPVMMPENNWKKLFSYLYSINSKINPFYKYGNILTKEIYRQIENRLRMLKKKEYYPDFVVLEWTYMVLFIDQVKKYFPNAKYIASEHDVSFLGYKRIYKTKKNKIKKIIKYISYKTMYKNELASLKKCDLIVTHNEKDKELLIENNIDERKINVIAPYYDKFKSVKCEKEKKNIIFYGAMNRKENYLSAIWFIDNVMTKLKHYDIRFVIVGNKPPEILKKRISENIIVTGFVNDPSVYFSTAFCLVAPLVLGAGVKVKVLEALSSGIPVLTNEIGIEGIDAYNMIEYIHCESADDYFIAIKNIINKKIDVNTISRNALKLIENKYDLKKSYENYAYRIYRLSGDK